MSVLLCLRLRCKCCKCVTDGNYFPATSGTPVQKEVWRSGADGAGEVHRVGETQAKCKWTFLVSVMDLS